MIDALDTFLEAASVAQKWRKLDPLERKLQKQIAAAFKKQGELFLRGFKQYEEQFPLEESVSDAQWSRVFVTVANATRSLFEEPVNEAIGGAMLAGGAQTIANLSVDMAFDLRNPRAVEYARNHAATMVTQVNDTTRQYLRTVIVEGVDNGWSYNRLARAITDRYAEFAVGRPQKHIRSRAELIAVTEIGQAYESASEIVALDLADGGLTMQKKWLTVGDDRVSAGCKENAGDGWIGMTEAHSSGHERPLRFPSCRCTELYRRGE